MTILEIINTSSLFKKKTNNCAFFKKKKNLKILLPISKCVLTLKRVLRFAVGQNTNGIFFERGVSLIRGIISFGGPYDVNANTVSWEKIWALALISTSFFVLINNILFQAKFICGLLLSGCVQSHTKSGTVCSYLLDWFTFHIANSSQICKFGSWRKAPRKAYLSFIRLLKDQIHPYATKAAVSMPSFDHCSHWSCLLWKHLAFSQTSLPHSVAYLPTQILKQYYIWNKAEDKG